MQMALASINQKMENTLYAMIVGLALNSCSIKKTDTRVYSTEVYFFLDHNSYQNGQLIINNEYIGELLSPKLSYISINQLKKRSDILNVELTQGVHDMIVLNDKCDTINHIVLTLDKTGGWSSRTIKLKSTSIGYGHGIGGTAVRGVTDALSVVFTN